MKKALLVALAAMAASAFAEGPKYVFLFIGDGMSVPQRMTADEFSQCGLARHRFRRGGDCHRVRHEDEEPLFRR